MMQWSWCRTQTTAWAAARWAVQGVSHSGWCAVVCGTNLANYQSQCCLNGTITNIHKAWLNRTADSIPFCARLSVWFNSQLKINVLSVWSHVKMFLLSPFWFEFLLSPARMCLAPNRKLLHNSDKEKTKTKPPKPKAPLRSEILMWIIFEVHSRNLFPEKRKSPEPLFISSLEIALEIQIVWLFGVSKY